MFQAVNPHGQAEANIKVTVIDAPGPPVGPLDYPQVTKNSVALKWSPPVDDGGEPITGKLVFWFSRNVIWNSCLPSPERQRINNINISYAIYESLKHQCNI